MTMKLKYKILIAIAPSVLILDQATKLAVASRLDLGARREVIAGLLDLVHFQNTGAAFGLFAGAHEGFRVPFFYGVAVLAAVLLALFFRSLGSGERLLPLSLSLVFGGMAGNLVDRVRLGAVTDFLSFHLGAMSLDLSIFGWEREVALEWPAFNVADSAITVAMFLLVYSALSGRRRGEVGR